MSSFEIGASRPVGAAQSSLAQPVANIAPLSAAPPTPPGMAPVQTAVTIAAGAAPIDQDRVSAIRKAVQSGTYPVIPAKISDAMIAAGLLLQRIPRQ